MRRLIVAFCAFVAVSGAQALEEPVAPKERTFKLLPVRVIQSEERIRVFVGYSDNVQFYPNSVATTPGKGGLLGGLSYVSQVEGMVHPKLSVGGALRADLIGYTGASNWDYSHYTLAPSVFVKHHHQLANGTKFTLKTSYGFRKTGAVNWDGLDSTSHRGAIRATFDHPGPWLFYAQGSIAYSDWDIFPADPLSDRDGLFSEAVIGASYDVGGTFLRKLSGSVAHQHNNADGINWSYSGFKVAGRVDFDLPGPWSADASASYAWRDYVGDFSSQALGGTRDKQTVASLRGRLVWKASPKHTVDFSLKHQWVSGGSAVFTGSRTTFTTGVTARLR